MDISTLPKLTPWTTYTLHHKAKPWSKWNNIHGPTSPYWGRHREIGTMTASSEFFCKTDTIIRFYKNQKLLELEITVSTSRYTDYVVRLCSVKDYFVPEIKERIDAWNSFHNTCAMCEQCTAFGSNYEKYSKYEVHRCVNCNATDDKLFIVIMLKCELTGSYPVKPNKELMAEIRERA